MKVLRLIAATLTLSATALADQVGTHRLGAILPLTGGMASYGQENLQALNLYFDELNRQNGIDGHKVELLVEDDRGEATDAINSIRKLITIDKLSLILGNPSSGNTLAMAPIAQRHKVTLLSPSGTSSKIPAVGDHIGHVCFADDYQAQVMAKYAYQNLGKRKMVILEDKSSDYSAGLTQAFKSQFVALGGEIVAGDFGYTSSDRDFRSLLIKVKRQAPDALYIPGYYTQAGMLIKQTRSLGLTTTILGADGFDSPVLAKTAGAVSDVYFTTHFSLDEQEKTVEDFVAKFKARYHSLPGAQAALAYDAAGMVSQALKECGYPCADLSTSLFHLKNYKGVTGTISFDASRTAVKDVVMIRITDGHNGFAGRLSP